MPVALPKGVEFKQSGNVVTVKGSKGALSMELNPRWRSRRKIGRLQVAAAFGLTFCERHVRARHGRSWRTWCRA